MHKIFPFIFLLVFGNALAQEQENYRIEASFKEDSFRLGQLLHFHLNISYPKDRVAIIPDSAYNFSPFEYVTKTYITTQIDSLYAYDSIVYTLSSFEINSVQRLTVPLAFFKGKDTLKFNTATDSVFNKRLINFNVNATLQEDTQLLSTIQKINYPYLIAGALVLLLTLLILYKLFGKIIIKRYRLIILNTTHKKFIKEYDVLASDFKKTADLRMIEQTLGVWKNYLTCLESRPINTFTTKELIGLYDQEELQSTLQSLDRNVYGGVASKDSNDALQTIKRFTNRRFQIRRREITNG